jgi:hypothetical protein
MISFILGKQCGRTQEWNLARLNPYEIDLTRHLFGTATRQWQECVKAVGPSSHIDWREYFARILVV